QGRQDRDRHPDRRDLVPPHRRLRTRKPTQPHDEQDHRKDVQAINEIRILQERASKDDHLPAPASASAVLGGVGFLLNIPNIRSVTKNPPTTLIVPKTIAITKIAFESVSLACTASPNTNKPPRTTIP